MVIRDEKVARPVVFRVEVRLVAPAMARVPVAVMLPPKYEFPDTPNFVNGEVVPIPKFPPAVCRRMLP